MPSSSNAVGRHGLNGASSETASSASARIRSTPEGHMSARSIPTQGSIDVEPSGIGPS